MYTIIWRPGLNIMKKLFNNKLFLILSSIIVILFLWTYIYPFFLKTYTDSLINKYNHHDFIGTITEKTNIKKDGLLNVTQYKVTVAYTYSTADKIPKNILLDDLNSENIIINKTYEIVASGPNENGNYILIKLINNPNPGSIKGL